MKTITSFIFLFFISISLHLTGQNTVNENILQRNFISNFLAYTQTNYLQEKHNLDIPQQISSDLIKLRKQYDLKLQQIFPPTPTEKNALKEAIKSYYSYYPDVNAVLLNRGNQFNFTVSEEEKTAINNQITEIWKKIPNKTFEKASKITDEINRKKFLLTVPYDFEIYRYLFDENVRKKTEVINFLLWNLN